LLGWGLAASFAGLLLVGMTGAIIALGDTLFFAHDRAGGTAETLPALVAVIVQFRAIHPLLAVLVGLFVAVVAWRAAAARPSHATRVLAAGLTGLYIVQLVAGAVNVALQVPVWMQLIHLLLADLVWIGLVLLAAAALAEDAPEGAGARVYAAASR
jgi:heme A synthase